MKGKEAQKIICEKLEELGWVRNGGTGHPTGIALSAAGFVASGCSHRPRYTKDSKRVTVGTRSTCLYEMVNGDAANFTNLETVQQIDEILKRVESI